MESIETGALNQKRTCSMSSPTSGSGVTLPDGALSPASNEVLRIFKKAKCDVDLTRQSTKDAMKKKPQELFDYLLENQVTNRTQFDGCPPSDVLSFLLMPQIESLLPRGFNYVSMQLRKRPFKPYTEEEKPVQALALVSGPNRLRKFLCCYQGWTVKQYKFFGWVMLHVANFNTQKKNCCWIWGPANTGKSTMMGSFINHFFPTGVGKPDNNPRSNFPFNNCVNKRVIFWEEPQITNDNIEDVKCLMSGNTFSTDIKYQSSVEIEKTPVYVTANKVPWYGSTDTNIMRSRCFCFKLARPVTEEDIIVLDLFPFTRSDWIQFFLETTCEGLIMSDDCPVGEPSYFR